jgi:hypothetical protein
MALMHQQRGEPRNDNATQQKVPGMNIKIVEMA